MASPWYINGVTDHTQCGVSNTSNFLLVVNATHPDFAQTASGGKSVEAHGWDVRPYGGQLLNALRYFLFRYVGASGTIGMIVEVPTLSVSVDTPVYFGVGDSSFTTNGSDASIFANTGGWYPLGDGFTLSLTDIANGINLTNAGATATVGPAGDGAARIAGDYSISNYPVLYRPNSSDFDYGTNSFSVRVAAKYGTQNSSQNNYPDIIGKQNVRSSDGANVGWELRIDTGGGGTDNHPQLVLWDQNGSLDFMDAGAAYNDNQYHLYHFTIDRGTGKLRFWADGVETPGSNATMSTTTVTSNYYMCLGARAFHEAFVFDCLNGSVAQPVLSAPGVVWSPSQVTAEYNMLKANSTFFTLGRTFGVQQIGLFTPLLRPQAWFDLVATS